MKMRYLTILLIGVAGFLVAANPARDDAKKDKDLFQGTWKLVEGSQNGVVTPPEQLAQNNVLVTIKGNHAITSASQIPASIIGNAGLEPAFQNLLNWKQAALPR